MRQARFRVARISFYIRDYTFYLSSLQISGLTVSKTTFPQFDNIACDRPTIWRKVQVKRRFPNKLGTRNIYYGNLIMYLDFSYGQVRHSIQIVLPNIFNISYPERLCCASGVNNIFEFHCFLTKTSAM